MNPRDALDGALESLTTRKLRTALSMLGMIFGVGAVIAMLSIGAGAERQALQMIERLGVHNLLVRSKDMKDDELEEIRKKSPGVSLRDALAIQQAVPGVECVIPRVEVETPKVMGAGSRTKAKVFGVSPRHADLFHLEVAEGRFLDVLDERDHAQVCVVGPGVRSDLFKSASAVGKDLKVNELWLEVVGVLSASEGGAESFQGVQVGSPEKEIYIPASTAMKKFNRDPMKSPVDELVVRLRPDASPAKAATVVRALLDRLHGGAEDYEMVIPEALLEQSRRTQRMFSIVMGCIAGISLLVGGIGIMNIMLASVLERTREIGIRMAVGAQHSDILFQFLAESSLISLAGGLSGIVMGVAIAWIVAASAGWPTVVTPISILLSFGVSLAVGLASGMYPAHRASRLDPIESLRFE